VPGNCDLDLKALAKTTGDKKIETVLLKEVEPLTGYVRGGVTALACKKPYSVYLDETVQLFDVMSISAGMRGLQILLVPDDYIRAVGAKLAPIAKGKEQMEILGCEISMIRSPSSQVPGEASAGRSHWDWRRRVPPWRSLLARQINWRRR
jgi:hypothetical protein